MRRNSVDVSEKRRVERCILHRGVYLVFKQKIGKVSTVVIMFIILKSIKG